MSKAGSRLCAATCLLGLVLGLGGWQAQALESDREQPIHITADRALRDEKQGFTVYSGNVKMQQGSLKIDADAITIYHLEEQADRIVGEGQPARLEQQPDPQKGPLRASAKIIEYFQAQERVHLRGDASIEQDGSTVNGDSIEYFMREQRVRADSMADGGQVEVTIPAQQLRKSE